ncbi:glycerol-3-phosphate 1-O-acyltransferase PlsY [Sphingorhabdus soli]|uniref:Glycerol-3-phosphate acyltransferase n=1 Tax=Flavisphingopyxis soli TaxID=2601267 RepID=A0A5C6UB73_9SPHN|nr:glycerol-3-phosphate 1-O-acyltransferase PlsY [Sphingorhabdus soli]TXC69125.1 glycerol-3-phosphate 1-O-acyltransferase PlsY [Sphingorhabdus soli]
MATTNLLWETPAAMLLMGYLLGSLPFGVILTRLSGAGDLRTIGSGNIGATNVLRTGRKGLAALTLLFDLLKGAAAVWIAHAVSPNDVLLAAVGAFVGHLYPIWLRFRGGKGVATLAGIWLALAWPVGLVYAVTWLVILAITRLSSLAGMLAAIAGPFAAVIVDRWELVPVGLAFALMVLWKHRSNIGRLLRGEEPKVGGSRASAA